jgi:hypothetical protein
MSTPPPMTAGVTQQGSSTDGIAWSILGQTYKPLHVTESSFSWHALLPPGTFVPPHVHPTQDEFIYIFEGRFDLVLDGQQANASAGDLIRLPRGIRTGCSTTARRTLPACSGSPRRAGCGTCSRRSTMCPILPRWCASRACMR